MVSSYAQQLPERVQRLSRLLALVCLAIVLLLPIAVAGYWATIDAGTLAVRANLPPDAVQGVLQGWQRVIGGVLTEIPLLLLLLGVWQARQCFLLFAGGRIFTAQAVACLKRFAGWAMMSALAEMVANALVSVVMTLNNPIGMRHLAIGFGSDQLFLLFFAAMVWLMAGVISQGQLLAEENSSFI